MDKEFRQYSITMAEQCTKEQLVDLYIAEVETCVEVEEQLAITEKALELACKHLEFCPATHGECGGCLNGKNNKCSNYFKTKAKEMLDE